MVKARYNGETDELIFIDGNIYEVTKIRKIGNELYYGLIDEVGDCCPCTKDFITIVEGNEDDLPVYEYDQKTDKIVRIR
jgi:hypothetical protein